MMVIFYLFIIIYVNDSKVIIAGFFIAITEKPIFSIDIHPNGERFATGGQGADSGRVAVWNIAPIFDEDIENDKNVPKQLCQMDNHLGKSASLAAYRCIIF